MKAGKIVLATSANDIVSGRMICPVNDSLTIMFGTSGSSLKSDQIKQNKHVALVCEELQIQAIAEFCGHPSEHPDYMEKNETKYPWMKSEFPPDPNDGGVLVVCHPQKISWYKFIDGKPHWDVLEVDSTKAYRM